MTQHSSAPFIGDACKPRAFRYTGHVAQTVATGIGVPSNVGGRPPFHAAFFMSVMPSRARFHGRALVGEPSGSPVPTFRYANFTLCPPTPIGVGRRASVSNVGGLHA
ncbi:hypothetical protein CDC45_12650 [Ralstonia pseudosolanacearum]|nr:hypothetical protein CDC45_12650 [Ralstonia pseudosolanacearum]